MPVWTDRNLRRDILVEVAAGLIVLVIGAVGVRVLPLVKWGLMYPAVFLPFLGGAVLMAGATLLAGWLVRRCRAPEPRMPYFRIKDAAVCVSSDGKVADSLKMVLEAISLAGEVTVSNNRFAYGLPGAAARLYTVRCVRFGRLLARTPSTKVTAS